MKNLKNIIAKTIVILSSIAFAALMGMAAPCFNFDIAGDTWCYLLLLSVLGAFFGVLATEETEATEEKGGDL